MLHNIVMKTEEEEEKASSSWSLVHVVIVKKFIFTSDDEWYLCHWYSIPLLYPSHSCDNPGLPFVFDLVTQSLVIIYIIDDSRIQCVLYNIYMNCNESQKATNFMCV